MTGRSEIDSRGILRFVSWTAAAPTKAMARRRTHTLLMDSMFLDRRAPWISSFRFLRMEMHRSLFVSSFAYRITSATASKTESKQGR